MSRVNDSRVVGIDLQPSEIRIVEIAAKGGKPTILRVGSGAMPANAIENGIILDSGILGRAVRSVLESMGIFGGVRAVVGVPSEAVVVTTVTIPPAPASEIPSLVRGELSQYSILRTAGAAHSFIELKPPSRGAEVEPIPIAVLGAEEDIIRGLNNLAEAAGIQIAALEPVQLGMFRTSFAFAGPSATGFHVMLGALHTDVAFVWRGAICFYRRFDVGSTTFAGHVEQSIIGDARGHDHADIQTYSISGASNLAIEIRRAIDYLSREYPDFHALDTIYLSLDRQESSELTKVLEDKAGMKVEVIHAPPGYAGSADIRVKLTSPDGSRYAGAFGLAAGQAHSFATAVPRVDLFSRERAVAAIEGEKRNVAGSVIVSAIALGIGAIGWIAIGRQVAKVEDESSRLSTQIASLNQQAVATYEERKTRQEQYQALRHEGLPVGVVMDYVCASLLPGVGLSTVRIGADLNVEFDGEALEEPLLLRSTTNLQRSPILSDVSVQSFQRAGPDKKSGITFSIVARTVGSDRLHYSFEKEGPQ